MSEDIRRYITLLEKIIRQPSPELLSWFGDSKIVDRNGDPLIVYHGTRRSFDKFERRSESHDSGIFFTVNTEYAAGYATGFGATLNGSNIVPAYLKIRNPFYCLTKPTDIQLKIGTRGAFTDDVIAHLEGQGYDGVIVGLTDYEAKKGYRYVEHHGEEICAFHPEQVRFALKDSE